VTASAGVGSASTRARCAPVTADPGILGATFGYPGMTALPASLRAVQPQARALYATGWRPSFAAGPTRDELAGIIQAALRPSPALAAV
jgi:hypothetical protein